MDEDKNGAKWCEALFSTGRNRDFRGLPQKYTLRPLSDELGGLKFVPEQSGAAAAMIFHVDFDSELDTRWHGRIRLKPCPTWTIFARKM